MKKISKFNNIPKYIIKRIVSLTAMVVVLVIVARLLSFSIPMVSNAAGKAAIISAGLTLPESGKNLSNNSGKNQNTKNDDTSQENEDEPPVAEFSQDEINKYSQNNGQIIRKTYKAGDTSQYIKIGDSAYIRNMTNLPNDTVINAANEKPAFKIDKSNEPQVLIVHTHTTEAYELTTKDYYDSSYPSRSLDNSRNVVRVGDEITKQLEKAGISVIHDTTVHDSPSYNGAYDRSKVTMEKQLKEHPSIKVILDIHRDAIGEENGPRYAPYTTINGCQASQLMIISGCDNGDGRYPNYLQNLAFASLLEKQTESDYPTLTRPVSFKYKYYNQSLTPGTLLVEIGGHANSVDESIYTGWMFGKSLARTLKSIEE